MIQHVFSIYDRDTATYNTPFFKPHIALALRDFKALCNDDKTTISRNPESFELRHLGTFNDQLGQVITDEPTTVSTAVACVEPSPQTMIPFPKESA